MLTKRENERLERMMGKAVTHFKNKDYLVIDTAEHTETGELLVIYKALYGKNKLYARPAKMFVGLVDKEKYPDVKQKYRMQLKYRGLNREPVKIEHRGCLNCSVILTKLEKDHYFSDGGSVHMYNLLIDHRNIELKNITLEEVMKKYKEDIYNADCVEISLITPLHDECYELDRETNEFVLVEQGLGYA